MVQPWYTSKVLWAAVLGFLMVAWDQYQQWQTTHTLDGQKVIAAIMAVLAIIFRWNADAALGGGGGDEGKRMAIGPGTRRGFFRSDRF